jgi:AcrR family transcriptional regulator
MKNNKTDQRSRYTQTIIKKSLLKLSADKPIDKITVTELCADAKTNRITFYSHFYDIDDVYESIEDDFYEEVMAKLKHIKLYDVERSLLREIIVTLYRNVDFCTMLLHAKSSFLKRIMDFIREKFVKEVSEQYKKIPIDVLEASHIFKFNGYYGLITDWIRNGMVKSPEEITDLIDVFNKITLDGLIKCYEK